MCVYEYYYAQYVDMAVFMCQPVQSHVVPTSLPTPISPKEKKKQSQFHFTGISGFLHVFMKHVRYLSQLPGNAVTSALWLHRLQKRYWVE